MNGDADSRRRLARRRRRVPAQPEDVDADHQRAGEPEAVLHPAVQDRRPERRDHLQRRQRRPDARPARRDRRRASWSTRGSACCRPTTRTSCARWPSWTRRSSATPSTATASCATTATATATASTDGHPWAPSNKGNGHVWPVLAGERGQWELGQGRHRRGRQARRRRWRAMGSGVGLIPEQAWELPDLAALAVRDRPDDRVDRLRQRQAGRLGRRADVVGRRSSCG